MSDTQIEGYLIRAEDLGRRDGGIEPLILYGAMPDVADLLRHRARIAAILIPTAAPSLSHAAVYCRETGLPVLTVAAPPAAFSEYITLSERGAAPTPPRLPRRAVTGGGTVIELLYSAWDVASAREAFDRGASGIGLFRTEGLAAERLPDLAGQYAVYAELCRLAGNRELTVRTFDFSGDKACLGGITAEAAATQLGALKAALCGGARVLLPNAESREKLAALQNHLRGGHGSRRTARCKVGAMIETESGLLHAAVLCQSADFVYVGLRSLAESTGLSGAALAKQAVRVRNVCALLGKETTVCGADLSDEAQFYTLLAGGFRRFVVAPAEGARAAELASVIDRSPRQTRLPHLAAAAV